MKFAKLLFIVLAILIILAFAAVTVGYLRRTSRLNHPSTHGNIKESLSFPSDRYCVDSSQSKFIAQAMLPVPDE